MYKHFRICRFLLAEDIYAAISEIAQTKWCGTSTFHDIVCWTFSSPSYDSWDISAPGQENFKITITGPEMRAPFMTSIYMAMSLVDALKKNAMDELVADFVVNLLKLNGKGGNEINYITDLRTSEERQHFKLCLS